MLTRLATTAFTAALLTPIATSQVYRAIDNADRDATVSTLDKQFLSIPGLFSDFMRSGGGTFVEMPNGTARLTGRVFALSSLYAAFLVDITFTGRIAPGDAGHPPVAGPDQRLLATAYAPNGAVDASQFAYYTAATGTLTGVRNYFGDVLTLTSNGVIQVGPGANNRNDHDGLQASFAVAVQQGGLTPTGTAELSFDFVSGVDETATHPQAFAQYTNVPQGRAMVLPGIADDYVFVPAANWQEDGAGEATLQGTLARLDDLADRWHVDLTLQNRIDPGEANYPPVGSPTQQMLPTAYVAGGGIIDPNHWHYYASATGVLTGAGDNAGGQIDLVANGATQVGGGANQHNSYFGFYGNYSASLVTQPTGRVLNLTGDCEMFGLNAVFPVLPFPSLTTPTSTPTLPTLTDQGVVVEGQNLAWVELGATDYHFIGTGDATDFESGWFEVLDNEHIRVHPRPGLEPGTYTLRFYNPAIQTNGIDLELTTPTLPTMVAEPAVATGRTVHVRMHPGPVVGPAFSIVTVSNLLGASSSPGVIDLEIGQNFLNLEIDPGLYQHDSLTGIAAANYGPIPASLLGQTFYFEAAMLDVGNETYPIPTTNYWRVDF